MRITEKSIFLLDGAGAVMSAFSTGIVLPMFAEWTGVPASVSAAMAVFPLAFGVYSFGCFWFAKRIRPLMLLAIIFANLFYCLLALALVFGQRDFTVWGKAFFAGEVLIILGVVALESSVYKKAFGAAAGRNRAHQKKRE